VDSGREENQMLSLDLQRRRLQRDLQRLNEEDAEGRRKLGEAADAERALLEQARLEREERDRQREESERRQFWLDAQIEFALQSIPSDIAGRFASEIQLSVEDALHGLGPGRPKPIVERVIHSAVQQVIQPWMREQERKRDVATAAKVAADPIWVRGLLGYPERQIRAQDEALRAILALPESVTSFDQMVVVGRGGSTDGSGTAGPGGTRTRPAKGTAGPAEART